MILEYAKYIYLFRTKVEDYESELVDMKKKWRIFLLENDLIH